MNRLAALATSLLLAVMLSSAPAHAASQGDWNKVDQVLGRQGKDFPGGVHKVGFPRSDLRVTLVRAPLAFGSWVAFMPHDAGAMLMGDLVLTETEIGPAMKRLLAGGMEITAVHNHLLRTSIPVIYMHVAGQGDPVQLAETVHAALALTGTPLVQGRATRACGARWTDGAGARQRAPLADRGADTRSHRRYSDPQARLPRSSRGSSRRSCRRSSDMGFGQIGTQSCGSIPWHGTSGFG